MNFSQQWIMMQDHPSTSTDASTIQHIGAHWRKGEAQTLRFLNLKYDHIRIYVVRLSKDKPYLYTDSGYGHLNG